MNDVIVTNQPPLVFTQRLINGSDREIQLTLSLTADKRTKTRRYVETDNGQGVYLRLPRGTVLHHGDVLSTAPDVDTASDIDTNPDVDTDPEEHAHFIQVIATAEPVMTAYAETSLDLLKAAYHLGNRHVPVEVATKFLRLSPDPVLKHMLLHMGLTVIDEVRPFEPEVGAYHHH